MPERFPPYRLEESQEPSSLLGDLLHTGLRRAFTGPFKTEASHTCWSDLYPAAAKGTVKALGQIRAHSVYAVRENLGSAPRQSLAFQEAVLHAVIHICCRQQALSGSAGGLTDNST
ncbi:hypothetical protein CB1_001428062 [Camelus ferus]|nr:hypothetical protein CB1_001428062 [Camelus ferus]